MKQYLLQFKPEELESLFLTSLNNLFIKWDGVSKGYIREELEQLKELLESYRIPHYSKYLSSSNRK